jgi:hypothetical protein
VEALHARWTHDAERERVNRTRFAQRAIKPEEVRRELEATDSVLGDPDAVREFVLSAAQRINLAVTPHKRRDVFRGGMAPGAVAALPDAIRFALPSIKASYWFITFFVAVTRRCRVPGTQPYVRHVRRRAGALPDGGGADRTRRRAGVEVWRPWHQRR